MPLATVKLMMPLLLLSQVDLTQCSEADRRLVADSYCSTYIKIIRDRGDGKIVATSEVKKRILANETTFRELCESHIGSK